MTVSSNGRKPIITIHDMTKVYQMGEHQVHALNGVSLDIYEGDFVSIMGPSGSGKSTLMNMLGALDQPTSGAYFLDGTDVSHLSDNDLTSAIVKLVSSSKISICSRARRLYSRWNYR